LFIGALLGALSVIIGAFGAHALKDTLTAHQRLDTFELAVKYQFYHSLAILIVGVLMLHFQQIYFQYAGFAFLIGVLIFSGSLYILALTNLKWLGAITPIGGLSMILGWLFLMIGILQSK
jgi:uncharacterized membrane protein YgdD (TMEM256/DUF423 family)